MAPACSRQKTEAVQEAPRVPSKPVSELLSSPAGQAPPAVPAPTEAPAAPVSSPSPTAAEPASPGIVAPNERQIIEDLQAALQAYYLKNVNSPNHLIAPRTLDELVKSGILKSLPNPPAGKRIVYHPENWLVTIE